MDGVRYCMVLLCLLSTSSTYDDIADHNHAPLRTKGVHLKTYTGKALEILGEP